MSSDKLDAGSVTKPAEFGKYYLFGLIARGGMAEVYRARLAELRRLIDGDAAPLPDLDAAVPGSSS